VLASSGSTISLPPGTADVFAWVDPGDRGLIESSATSLTLGLPDIGNVVLWFGSVAGTVALPAIAAVPPGASFLIRNAGSALLTLDGNASETINGVTTWPLPPGASTELIRHSTGWFSTGGGFGWVPTEAPRVLSGASVADFLLPAAFRMFRFTAHLRCVTDQAQLWWRSSVNAGVSFAGSAADYVGTAALMVSATTFAVSTSTAGHVTIGHSQDATSGSSASLFVGTLHPGDGTLLPRIQVTQSGVFDASGSIFEGTGTLTGYRADATRINACRFLASTGTLSGLIQMEGLVA